MQQKETQLPQVHAVRQHRRRSSPRISVNRRAVISLPKTGRPHPVLLVDVSSGGACVQADIDLAIGDAVVMRVELGADIRFSVRALVTGVRLRRHALYGQYGLRFTGVDAAASAAIQSIIEQAPKSA